MLDIPVVIVAYERPAPLKRLLKSINNAVYEHPVKLIISIDYKKNNEVVELVNDFVWEHGSKKIIKHKKKLGLREHILFCGDLVQGHDAVILLEDDLYVSPYYYKYTQDATRYYLNDSQISGVSLYSHSFNETPYLPFVPLCDGSDVFFMQIPSSWGQCWTVSQWNEFKKWYELNHQDPPIQDLSIPDDIQKWPESSWKKHFCYYMIATNKYFVYPRYSLTSNFSDPGTHIRSKKYIFQRPLLYAYRDPRFIDLSESRAVYDIFCEIFAEKLKGMVSYFQDYQFEVDIYGSKPLDKIKKTYLLSSKSCENPIFSFSRDMKPHEANVIENIEGSDIFFGKTTDFGEKRHRKYSIKELLYYYDIVEYLHIKEIQEEIRQKYKTLKKKIEITSDIPEEEEIVPTVSPAKFFFLRVVNVIRIHKFRLPIVIFTEIRNRLKNQK